MSFNVDNKFFRKDENGITCLLCQHYCHLKDGQFGVCGANKNENGKLVNIVYGKPVAIHIDPIEKKPLYHFLPSSTALSIGTIGCNMQCPFCQNWQISQVRRHTSQSDIIAPQEIVQSALENNCKSIAYTYNEPAIFYPYARDIALIAKEKGLKNIFVTNGLESKELIEDMNGIIDACNVDFKSINPDFYKKVLKAPFGILDTLKLIKNTNIWLEVTTLIIPGENDSDEELNAIAGFIADELGTDTPWHISAFFPQYKMTDKSPTPLSLLRKAYDIGKNKGLEYIYTGNAGLENPTVCPKCNTILIERKGYRTTVLNLNKGQCSNCGHRIPGVWE